MPNADLVGRRIRIHAASGGCARCLMRRCCVLSGARFTTGETMNTNQHQEILRTEGLSKFFPGVKALDNVDFSLAPW